MKCRHCRTSKATYGRRGLCHRCHGVPEIRRQYGYAEGRGYRCPPDETEEDLDRLIEEQRKQLPDWWDQAEKIREAHELPSGAGIRVVK